MNWFLQNTVADLYGPYFLLFYAAAKSSSGTCYYIKDDVAAGTNYAKGSGTCDGSTAATQAYTANGWS